MRRWLRGRRFRSSGLPRIGHSFSLVIWCNVRDVTALMERTYRAATVPGG